MRYLKEPRYLANPKCGNLEILCSDVRQSILIIAEICLCVCHECHVELSWLKSATASILSRSRTSSADCYFLIFLNEKHYIKEIFKYLSDFVAVVYTFFFCVARWLRGRVFSVEPLMTIRVPFHLEEWHIFLCRTKAPWPYSNKQENCSRWIGLFLAENIY